MDVDKEEEEGEEMVVEELTFTDENSLKRSHHIKVRSESDITFTMARIDDGHKCSLSFKNAEDRVETYIYHSHGSNIYYLLRPTFDLTGMEKECLAKHADTEGRRVLEFKASAHLRISKKVRAPPWTS